MVYYIVCYGAAYIQTYRQETEQQAQPITSSDARVGPSVAVLAPRGASRANGTGHSGSMTGRAPGWTSPQISVPYNTSTSSSRIVASYRAAIPDHATPVHRRSTGV